MQLYRGMDIVRPSCGQPSVAVCRTTSSTCGRSPSRRVWPISAGGPRGHRRRPRPRPYPSARGRIRVVPASGAGAFRLPRYGRAVRAELEAELAAVGPAPLHNRLAELDPAAAARILPATVGASCGRWRWCGSPAARSWPSCPCRGRTTRLSHRSDLDTETLDGGLACGDQMWARAWSTRCDSWSVRVAGGPYRGRALGYHQVLEYLAGGCSEEQARAATIQATKAVRAPPAVVVPPR